MEIQNLPVESIVRNEWNPNAMPEEAFQRLVQEIDTVGFLEPVQVVPLTDGTYRLLGGEHRVEACKKLGRTTVPAVVLTEAKWQDEDLQKFVTVRLNVLKGKLDPVRMAALYQEMADKYGDEALQDMFAYCLKAGTIVETATGPREIDSVRVGDWVFAGDGKLRQVVKKVEEYVECEMLEVHVERVPFPIVMTPGHHMFVCRRDWDASDTARRRVWKPVEEVRAEELLVGDALQIPGLQQDGVQALKIPEDAVALLNAKGRGKNCKRIPESYVITEDLGWFLGLYAADGGYHEASSEVSVVLASHERVHAERVVRVLKETFGIESAIHPSSSPNAVVVRAWSRVLGRTLIAWCGSSAENKRIPTQLQVASAEIRSATLDGLWIGDGTAYNETRAFTSISERLSYQFVRLLVTNGFSFSLCEIPEGTGKDGCFRKKRYQIRWSEGSHAARKSRLDVDGCLVSEIKEIRSVPYAGFIYDLGLEQEHSYIAGLVRVGNTDKTAWSAALTQIRKGLEKSGIPKKIVKEFDDSAKEIKTTDDLSSILNHMMTKYGDTVQQSFMILTYGSKNHLYVALDKPGEKAMRKVVKYCRDTGADINEILLEAFTQVAQDLPKPDKKAPAKGVVAEEDTPF